MGERFVPANGAWDVDAAMVWLRNHATPGLERQATAAGTHTRVLVVAGRPHVVTVQLQSGGVLIEQAGGADLDRLTAAVAWWFDLDTDVAPIDQHLGKDPFFAGQLERRPGVRVTHHPDGFEAAITTVLGQQVSVARARTFTGRIVGFYGEPVVDGYTAFPLPERIAEQPAEELRARIGLTRSRTRTLQSVAALFADGFSIGPAATGDGTWGALRGLHGIGDWTISCLALRATSDRDAFPASDLGLRRALGGVDTATAATRSLRWSPHRSYAAERLWTMAREGTCPIGGPEAATG